MVRKCRKAKGMVEAGCVKDGIGVSSTYMQLRSRRIVYISLDCKSENSSSVDNGVSSSCCASNECKNKLVVENGFIDLEEERDDNTETSTYQCTKRKLFENLKNRESRKSMENSSEVGADFESSVDYCCSERITSSTTEEKTKSTTEQPTETEIEEFFMEAEKKLQEKFKKKYNFDFEKEKPLEGEYKWVKLSE